GLATVEDAPLTLNPLPYYDYYGYCGYYYYYYCNPYYGPYWYGGPWWGYDIPVPATEGEAFSATIMEFGDEDPKNALGDYYATIWWGDGTPKEAGQVGTDGHGGYYVQGTHVYNEEGYHRFSVEAWDRGGSSAFLEEGIYVQDAPLHGHPKNFSSGL